MLTKNEICFKKIKSDVYRYYGKCSNFDIIKYWFSNSLIRFHVAFRLKKGTGFVKQIGRILWKMNRKKKDIQILPNTKIGYGLYIGHGGPIVIHETAVIGNNVNLSQFTTIGSNNEKAATIGDFTYIGPNVCIVEDVKIGNYVTIGAGSVVTKDIPDYATACGNYAKVVNYNNPGIYTMNNRWMDFSED